MGLGVLEAIRLMSWTPDIIAIQTGRKPMTNVLSHSERSSCDHITDSSSSVLVELMENVPERPKTTRRFSRPRARHTWPDRRL